MVAKNTTNYAQMGVYLPINMVISQSDMVIYHHLANKDVDLTLW